MRYRISRRRYLILTLLWVIPASVLGMMAGDSPEARIMIRVLFGPVWIWAGVGRLHDFGQSGWWVLLTPLPLGGFVLFLVLLFAPPTTGANAYGPNPRPGERRAFLGDRRDRAASRR